MKQLFSWLRKKPPTVEQKTEHLILNEAALARLERVLGDKSTYIWRNLVAGFVWGLGYILALAFGLALIVSLVRGFVDVPLVGEYAQKILTLIDSAAVITTPSR